MFFSNNLSDIEHCFFSKLGGNSKKIYSSLNCGMGSSDNKTHVKKNLSYISRYYELSSKSLITMYQTHSTKCKVIKNNTSKVEEYKSGKEKLFGFFVGQVMKESKGKGNPQLINKILKEKLNG